MDNQTQVNQTQTPVVSPQPPQLPIQAPPLQQQAPFESQPLQQIQPQTTPPQMNPRQQVAARIKQSNNVLVTVNANPNVDELAACIGLTLILNKLGKHATAVFSGTVPPIMEFLEPEKTIEKNTDSLRDFIIALDKAKADKLRYKVEDKVVKIFITPYRTSISEKDLEFSQGDLNVDVVVALGVRQQQELDQAITAHGRILHDATIISVNNTPEQINLGAINWQDTTISSLSELVTSLAGELGGRELIDSQTATALLTGIVAVTKRFSNSKTSPQTMSASAILMAAGANQQLVATKMEPPPPPPPPPTPKAAPVPPPVTVTLPAPVIDGTLTIDHGDKKPAPAVPPDSGLTEEERLEQIRIDNQGMLHKLDDDNTQPPAGPSTSPTSDSTHFMAQPPSSLEAAGGPNPESDMDASPSADLEGEDTPPPPTPPPLLDHDGGNSPEKVDETLQQIEKDVDSPHLTEAEKASADVAAARSAVDAQSDTVIEPIAALNAQPLGAALHPDPNSAPATPTGADTTTPPPVPPPMIPPVMPTNDNQNL